MAFLLPAGIPADLPGRDTVARGLADLVDGRATQEACLVAIVSHRLRDAGVDVPSGLPDDPKDRLWRLLERDVGDDAHGRYNWPGSSRSPTRWTRFERRVARPPIRAPVDASRVRAFYERLGLRSRSEATVYLVGDASAVLVGWRPTTRDIDLAVEPDSATGWIGDEIARLKPELGISVEFASPPDFIPELPGWPDRSPFVAQVGSLTVRHFDFYSQALAKVRRGVDSDAADVEAMLSRGLVAGALAWELYDAIVPALPRYPAVDEPSFRARMVAAFGGRPNR